MPTIPQITPQAVGTQQLAAPRVAPFQDQSGQQMQDAGIALARAGVVGVSAIRELQSEYDDAKIQQGDALAAEAIEKAMYAPDGGLLTLRGQAALGKVRKDKFTELDKELQRIGTTLDSDAQRKAYDLMSGQRMRDARFRADVHEAEQTRAFSIGSLEARGEILKADAINSYGTADYGKHRAAFLDVVDRLTALKGGGDDEKKAAQRQAISALVGDNVQQLVERGAVSDARSLLAREGDAIEPRIRTGLEKLVRQATVDEQSFQAARFIESKETNLVKQIEALRQLHEAEPQGFPIEVLDAAEQRLRATESTNYQNEARVGNEAMQQAEAYATKNRIKTYAQLPLEIRHNLEATGRSMATEVWLEQGMQNVTTTRGTEIMRRALDPQYLRATPLEVLQAATRSDLSRRDGDTLTAAWYEANEVPPPKGVGDAMVGMTVTRRMMEMGYLPADKDPSDIQKNRRNWVLEQVQRTLGSGAHTAAQVDEAVETALGATMGMATNQGLTGLFSTDVILPESAMTPKERQEGFYRTAYGKVPANQVNQEMQKAKQAEVDAINAARRAHNATAPADQQEALLPSSPEAVVGMLRTAQELRRIARDRAYKDAMGWMRSNRPEFGQDAWHHLPAELLAPLQATGMAPSARMDYENYDRTHDFLGRRKESWQSNPNSPMHGFASPWGR